MKKLILLFALFAVSENTFATEIEQIKFKLNLGITRCDSTLVDGKPQNCEENAAYANELSFDLTKNCKQAENSINCASSQMITTRMDKGSATAIIVLSKKKEAGTSQIFATIMLIPNMDFTRKSVLNLTLSEAGQLPQLINLQAAIFQVEGDSRLYFPSLDIQ